jgi:hypothetical protein
MSDARALGPSTESPPPGLDYRVLCPRTDDSGQ